MGIMVPRMDSRYCPILHDGLVVPSDWCGRNTSSTKNKAALPMISGDQLVGHALKKEKEVFWVTGLIMTGIRRWP